MDYISSPDIPSTDKLWSLIPVIEVSQDNQTDNDNATIMPTGWTSIVTWDMLQVMESETAYPDE